MCGTFDAAHDQLCLHWSSGNISTNQRWRTTPVFRIGIRWKVRKWKFSSRSTLEKRRRYICALWTDRARVRVGILWWTCSRILVSLNSFFLWFNMRGVTCSVWLMTTIFLHGKSRSISTFAYYGELFFQKYYKFSVSPSSIIILLR